MVAFALTTLAIRHDQPEPATTTHDLTHPTGPIAVTVNEARHLIAAIILATQPVGRALIDHLLSWSIWRRNHQTHARAAHYRHRLAIANC